MTQKHCLNVNRAWGDRRLQPGLRYPVWLRACHQDPSQGQQQMVTRQPSMSLPWAVPVINSLHISMTRLQQATRYSLVPPSLLSALVLFLKFFYLFTLCWFPQGTFPILTFGNLQQTSELYQLQSDAFFSRLCVVSSAANVCFTVLVKQQLPIICRSKFSQSSTRC